MPELLPPASITRSIASVRLPRYRRLRRFPVIPLSGSGRPVSQIAISDAKFARTPGPYTKGTRSIVTGSSVSSAIFVRAFSAASLDRP